MTLFRLAGSAALTLLLGAAPLLADVTPEEVWQRWQDNVAAQGARISADPPQHEGKTLVMRNVRLTVPDASDARLGQIRLQPLGNGTVSIALPQDIAVEFGDTVFSPQPDRVTIALPGARIIASGTADDLEFATTLPRLTLRLDQLEGKPARDQGVTLELTLEGVTGQSRSRNAHDQSWSLAAASASLLAKGKDQSLPEGAAVDLKASAADLTASWKLSQPSGPATADLSDRLRKGLQLAASLDLGATSFDVVSTEDQQSDQPVQIIGGLTGGGLTLGLDGQNLDLTARSQGAVLQIASDEMPVKDASLSYGAGDLHLRLPSLASPDPADFALTLKVSDLAPSAAIWAQLDLGAALPHDPAALEIDTRGQMTLTRDLLAEDKAPGSGFGGVLNALQIPGLHLSALGAEVMAQGGFTFDPTDLTSFSGLPAPEGKLEIKATGLNRLIDSLARMGAINQGEAMQGKMLLAMFANTAPDKDAVSSRLEFRNKHLYVNGQRLQ